MKFRLCLLIIFVFPIVLHGLTVWEAAADGDLTQVENWIDSVGLDVDILDDNGNTPLFYAVSSDNVDVVEYLINHYANINFMNIDGLTPLLSSVLFRNQDAAELIIQAGADLDITDDYGNHVIFTAIFNDQKEIVELLLANGVDVNIKDIEGYSAIKYAIERGDYSMVEALIEYGADLNDAVTGVETGLYVIPKDYNLLEYAVQCYLKDNKEIDRALIVKYLYEHNSDVRRAERIDFEDDLPEDICLNTQMRLYTLFGNLEKIEELLKLGVDPANGEPSSLQLAILAQLEDVSDYFNELGFYGASDANQDIMEGLDTEQTWWMTSGDQNWELDDWEYYFPQDGDSLRTASIGHYQVTSIEMTASGSEISFYWKVSCELEYDFLSFYIDNVQIDMISGYTEWEEVNYPLTEGFHQFKWEYSKDGSVSEGNDCGWIDYLIITE